MGAGVWIFSIIIALVFLVAIGAFAWFYLSRKTTKCTKTSGCTQGEFCDDGKCIPYGKCSKSFDCIGDQVCSGGECVQCGTSKDCTKFPGKPVCFDNQCVGCDKDSDCKSGVCNISTKECIACTADSQCPGGKCLHGSTPALNRCVQCIKTSDCPTGKKCVGNICLSSKAYFQKLIPPPSMPPMAYLGPYLKRLKTPVGDPFAPYNEYQSSW